MQGGLVARVGDGASSSLPSLATAQVDGVILIFWQALGRCWHAARLEHKAGSSSVAAWSAAHASTSRGSSQVVDVLVVPPLDPVAASAGTLGAGPVQ